ncbi:hypothetical protein GCM10025868_28450 [Angustibacter aerolatus]|uniref:Glycosyl transferase family 1 domain-containing protein n=1 Tax=Angustibacter aerolatus TaxID=1162965 RepID=A0ABQ6JLD1_9ACTN|nr:hypothetical protein GCM10025868_28450 [Angustibacter aerolatus]
MPSHSESFGLVALEAQACGTPVVAAAVGGLCEAVRDGESGLLVDGHEPGAWATALARVLDDDVLRARLGAGAVRQAARYSLGRHGRPPRRGVRRGHRRARPAAGAGAAVQPADPAVSERERVEALVLDQATASGVEHERGARPGEVVATLPGEHKQRTTVSLLVGDHSLSASAFVVRRPDERVEEFQGWLLRRNARLQGVAFCQDADGDVYLVGRLPLVGVTPETFDGLLGTLLDVADSSFDPLLGIGFLTAMRREWAWRVSRGESTRNLDAFRHLLAD